MKERNESAPRNPCQCPLRQCSRKFGTFTYKICRDMDDFVKTKNHRMNHGKNRNSRPGVPMKIVMLQHDYTVVPMVIENRRGIIPTASQFQSDQRPQTLKKILAVRISESSQDQRSNHQVALPKVHFGV